MSCERLWLSVALCLVGISPPAAATRTGAGNAPAQPPAKAVRTSAKYVSPLPKAAALGKAHLTVKSEEVVVTCREVSRYRLTCAAQSVVTIDVDLPPRAAGTESVEDPTPWVFAVAAEAERLEYGGQEIALEPLFVGSDVKTGVVDLADGVSTLRLTTPNSHCEDLHPASDLFDSAAMQRHPLLGVHPGEAFAAPVKLISLAGYRTHWKTVERSRFVLVFPSRFEPQMEPDGKGPASSKGTSTLEWTMGVDEELSTTVNLRAERGWVQNGGVVVGSAYIAESSGRGLRVWLGYDVAISDVIISTLLQYAGDDRVMVVPVFEVVPFASIAPIPAVGLGVGAPIQLSSNVGMGFRLQLTATWEVLETFSVGAVAMCEWYPASADEHVPCGGGIQLGI